jgi:phosphatidate cytidylyltransferase
LSDPEDVEVSAAPGDASGREDRPTTESGPPTIELRIDAVAAAVAAGLTTPAPDEPGRSEGSSETPAAEATAGFELPDWSEPATGQIPRVLLEDPDALAQYEPLLRKPTWRAQREQWNEGDFDLSFLAAESDASTTHEIAGSVVPDATPFGFAELDEPTAGSLSSSGDDVADERAWEEVLTPVAAQHRRHAAHRARRAQRSGSDKVPAPAAPDGGRPSTARNALVATATGAALGLVALLCFLGGPAPTDGLVAVGSTFAAGEFFGALQRGGYRPATIIGILAVPASVLAAYNAGPSGIAVVVALTFIATGVWFLREGASREPIVDGAVTIFVVCWVGVLAGFASLLLAPASHPFGHGIALIFGVIACTVGHDIGSYAVGSKFGRRKIAPRISPGKTIEGLIGGTVVDLVVAGLIVARVHPLGLGIALGLGGVVAVVAPIGDLIESSVKRDLGVKDMGTVLPAHGGVFDRIDAMLVVMPVAYLLFRIGNVA